MPEDLTENALHWANLGDNRVGPIISELVIAISEMTDPHDVRRVARNLKFLSSSINTMAHHIAERESHDRQSCPICQSGAIL